LKRAAVIDKAIVNLRTNLMNAAGDDAAPTGR